MLNVYTNIENLKIPQSTIKLAAPVLFPGNVEKHALTWFQSRREISCNKAGANLSEYNLQFINIAKPSPERFMGAIRENYTDVLMTSIFCN